MAEKKYYWLKLKRDFFKRHDIQIIESMPNGKDYILFYLKLLVESVDHDGNLRFNDTIPYSESMLSTITNTNIDVVKSAMSIFTELDMIEILSDNTIFMCEVEKMLGTETYWADKKRVQRLKESEQKKQLIGHCPSIVQSVQVMSKEEKETDIDKDKDKDKDKEIKKEPKAPPKISFAEFVTLTQVEFDTLAKELGSEFIVEDCIEILDNYKGSSGKKYKSDYRAIKSWVIDKYKEKHKEGGQRGQSTSNNGQNVFKDEDLPNQIIL